MSVSLGAAFLRQRDFLANSASFGSIHFVEVIPPAGREADDVDSKYKVQGLALKVDASRASAATILRNAVLLMTNLTRSREHWLSQPDFRLLSKSDF